MGQDALAVCKEAVVISDEQIKLMKQQLAAQDAYIKQLKQQRDEAVNKASAGPSLMHDLGCGLVGAAAGIVLIRGFR